MTVSVLIYQCCARGKDVCDSEAVTVGIKDPISRLLLSGIKQTWMKWMGFDETMRSHKMTLSGLSICCLCK